MFGDWSILNNIYIHENITIIYLMYFYLWCKKEMLFLLQCKYFGNCFIDFCLVSFIIMTAKASNKHEENEIWAKFGWIENFSEKLIIVAVVFKFLKVEMCMFKSDKY